VGESNFVADGDDADCLGWLPSSIGMSQLASNSDASGLFADLQILLPVPNQHGPELFDLTFSHIPLTTISTKPRGTGLSDTRDSCFSHWGNVVFGKAEACRDDLSHHLS